MSAFFEVMIERNFSSAHQLRGYKGKCENLHGHNYKVEIYARGEELNNIGLLIDFGELKDAADEIVKYLDHRNLMLRPLSLRLLFQICQRLPERVRGLQIRYNYQSMQQVFSLSLVAYSEGFV